MEGSSDTLDVIQVRIDARNQAVAVQLQAEPGAMRLDHQLTLLTDLTNVPQARHTGAARHRAGKIRTGQDDFDRSAIHPINVRAV